MYESDEDPQAPDSQHSWLPSLSSDERDVLAVSATGRTTTEVAEILGYSPDQARHILARAMLKLGARSKLEAVVLALRNGLIRPSCEREDGVLRGTPWR